MLGSSYVKVAAIVVVVVIRLSKGDFKTKKVHRLDGCCGCCW